MLLPTQMLGLVRALGLSSLIMLPGPERRTLLFHVPTTPTQLTASTLTMLELPAEQTVCDDHDLQQYN